MFNLRQQILGLLVALGVVFIAAALGAFASVQAGAFYAGLQRPGWAPPGWLFGPVWTLLYTMMGIAAWLVWRQVGLQAGRKALGVFLLQLVFNALWSWLFFAWSLGAWAFVDILLLLGLIAANVILFSRISMVAGLLLVPYGLWVCFAAVLNFSVWQLNPQILG